MHELATVAVAVGLITLLLGIFSAPLRRWPVSEPLVALAAGVLLGPVLTGMLDLHRWGDPQLILAVAAEVTLAIGLMAVGLRTPRAELRSLWRSIVVLLVLGMGLMWVISAALLALILGLPLLVALIVGAILAPTDPVVASTIVTGREAERNLPARLRHLISAESGFNDGLALPFVAVPLVLLVHGLPGGAVSIAQLLFWEVAGGAIAGLAIGLVGGRLLRWADERHTIETSSFLAYSVALSLFVLGALELARMHSVLGVFMAAVGMSLSISSHERMEEENVQDAVNRFFSIPVFLFLGLALPWDEWQQLGVQGLVAVVAILGLRRLLTLLLIGRAIPALAGRADVLFVGWFGPIAVAALFYVTTLPDVPGLEVAWPMVSLVIVGSIVAHGVTASSLTRLYGSRGTPAGEKARDHPTKASISERPGG